MKKILQKLTLSGSGLLFQATGFVSLSKVDQQSSQLSGIFGSTDLATFIQRLFVFALSIGAIIAVVRLMWAGYLYMGSDMWSSKSRAREIFVNVIIGILLLLSIWLILNLINPQILNLDVLGEIHKTPVTGSAPSSGGQPQGPVTCGAGCSYCDTTTGNCLVPSGGGGW
jgi:Type IV secretion system pilin